MSNLTEKLSILGRVTGDTARFITDFNATLAEGHAHIDVIKSTIGDGPFNRATRLGRGNDGIKYGSDVRLSTMPHHHGLWAVFGLVHAPLVELARFMPRALGDAGFTVSYKTDASANAETRTVSLNDISLEQRANPSSIWARLKEDPDQTFRLMVSENFQAAQYEKGVLITDFEERPLEASNAQRILWGFFSGQGMNALRGSPDPDAEKLRWARMILGLDDMDVANRHLMKMTHLLRLDHDLEVEPAFDQMVERNGAAIRKRFPDLLVPRESELVSSNLTTFLNAEPLAYPNSAYLRNFRELAQDHARETLLEILKPVYGNLEMPKTAASVPVTPERTLLIESVQTALLRFVGAGKSIIIDLTSGFDDHISPKLFASKAVMKRMYTAAFTADQPGQSLDDLMDKAARLYLEVTLGKRATEHLANCLRLDLTDDIASTFRRVGQEVVYARPDFEQSRPNALFAETHHHQASLNLIRNAFGEAAAHIKTPKGFQSFVENYENALELPEDAEGSVPRDKDQIRNKRCVHWLEEKQTDIVDYFQAAPKAQEALLSAYRSDMVGDIRRLLHVTPGLAR